MSLVLNFRVAELPQRVDDINRSFDSTQHTSHYARGANASVVKVKFADGLAAIKRYPRDGRNRLDHEFAVLAKLPREIKSLAPRPLARTIPGVRTEYGAYEWVDGVPLRPDDSAAIQAILSYFRELHSASEALPATMLSTVPKSLLNQNSVVSGPYGMNSQFRILAVRNDVRLAEMRRVYEQILSVAALSGLKGEKEAVCHTDSNPANFLRTSTSIIAVDWDAGGLGDPLFEVAELSCHPALPFYADEQWVELVRNEYDPKMNNAYVRRFITYRHLAALWWCARLIRQEGEGFSRSRDVSARRVDEMMAYLRR